VAREVLGYFVGRWDITVELREGTRRGQAECVWTMDDTYVEFRSLADGESDLQIMTWSDGEFLMWYFDSSGYRHEATGSWDPATRVLTWKGPNGLLIEDHWVSPERLEWTMLRSNLQVSGVVSKRAPAPGRSP
jgi:hypothetical protein